MTNDFYLLSILLGFQAPIICLIICGVIFITLKLNGITRKQYILMRCLAIGCSISMLGEVLFGIVAYGVVDWPMHAVLSVQTITYCALLFNTIVFCELCISSVNHASKFLKFIVRLFYVITGITLIARMFFMDTNLFSYVNENNELIFGPLDDIQFYGYIICYFITLLLVLSNYFRRDEYANRERNSKMLFSIVLVTIAFVVYILTYIPYVIWMAYMFALLYLYIELQTLMVYSDELTSLSNRRRLLIDIQEYIKSNSNWGYIISDVNKFKSINDTYGHYEGDRALSIVSKALKEVTKNNDGEAYRIGGDEFAVIVPDASHDTLRLICDAIDNKLKEYCNHDSLKYSLTLSSGYKLCEKDKDNNIADIMNFADNKMYKNKQSISK